MIRLPKNPEDWTGAHADRALADAWKEFERYEAKVNFEAPREMQEELYRSYQLAKELAIDVARYTRWRVRETERLP